MWTRKILVTYKRYSHLSTLTSSERRQWREDVEAMEDASDARLSTEDP